VQGRGILHTFDITTDDDVPRFTDPTTHAPGPNEYLAAFERFEDIAMLPHEECADRFVAIGRFRNVAGNVPRRLQLGTLLDETFETRDLALPLDDVEAIVVPLRADGALARNFAVFGTRAMQTRMVLLEIANGCEPTLSAEVEVELDVTTIPNPPNYTEPRARRKALKFAATATEAEVAIYHYDGYTLRRWRIQMPAIDHAIAQQNFQLHDAREDIWWQID